MCKGIWLRIIIFRDLNINTSTALCQVFKGTMIHKILKGEKIARMAYMSIFILAGKSNTSAF